MVNLKKDQFMNVVLSSKTVNSTSFVLPNSLFQLRSNANVQDVVVTGRQNVYASLFHRSCSNSGRLPPEHFLIASRFKQERKPVLNQTLLILLHLFPPRLISNNLTFVIEWWIWHVFLLRDLGENRMTTLEEDAVDGFFWKHTCIAIVHAC